MKYIIGIKESDGKPLEFFKGIDPPNGPLGQYLRSDYTLEDAVEFADKDKAIEKAKWLEGNYGPLYCYVLTVEGVS